MAIQDGLGAWLLLAPLLISVILTIRDMRVHNGKIFYFFGPVLKVAWHPNDPRFIKIRTSKSPSNCVINTGEMFIGISSKISDAKNVQVHIEYISDKKIKIRGQLLPKDTAGNTAVDILKNQIAMFQIASLFSMGERSYSVEHTDISQAQYDAYAAHAKNHTLLIETKHEEKIQRPIVNPGQILTILVIISSENTPNTYSKIEIIADPIPSIRICRQKLKVFQF